MSDQPAVSNQQLLDAFATLRVADVRDGMDSFGYHRYGSMSPAIRPLFRARICGIARTVRYLPYRGPAPTCTPDDYMKWAGWYYGNVCTYPWVEQIEPGDVVVIDQSGVDAGLMGSENTLSCMRRGCRGLITSGGVRDTDEIILQQVPFWSAMVSQSMVQTRLQFESTQTPIAVGGVAVFPGDVVVADGDGVIVVPRQVALDVAHHADAEHQRDKKTRKQHYEALGKDLDETVR